MKLVPFERMVGRKVLDPTGRKVGRIVAVRVDWEEKDCVVRDYLLGTAALMERLGISAKVFLGMKLNREPRSIAWDLMDISDPEKPRLLCPLAEIEATGRAGEMNERPNLLLTASAVVYFAAAIPLLFAPDEMLAFAGAAPSRLDAALLQVVGSAVLGFSMLDWMSRYTRIGGIYGRPLVVANLAHSASAALLLGKAASRVGFPVGVVVPLGIYGVLAVGFGIAMFSRPQAD